MAVKTIYMIRHKATGLYKLGGSWGGWSKKGKVWMGLGPLKLHLNLYKTGYPETFPEHLLEEMKQWEIVAIQVTEAESHTFTIKQLYQ